MNTTQFTNRIHPMVAVAAASVTLASLLGIAALTGILPSSHGSAVNTPNLASQNSYESSPAPIAVQSNGPTATTHKTVVRHVPNNPTNPAQHPTGQVAQGESQQQPAPAPTPAPVQQKQAAAPHNSPIGIGVGAVIGGLLGNQVGSGNGKTLATIAGAVGGGYVGNEVAKRNQ